MDFHDEFICDNRHCEDRRQRTLKELRLAKYRVDTLERLNPDMVQYLENAEKKKESLSSKLTHNQNDNLAYSAGEQEDRTMAEKASGNEGGESTSKRRKADFETIL